MAKNRLDYQANLSRHSHDISAGYSASLAPGMIVPQYFDILGPGDSIYYRTHLFARLQKVVTAFLGEVDIHVEYFFVPLQMLYTPFGQIFAQTDDYLSDIYSSIESKDDFPLFKFPTQTQWTVDETKYGVNSQYNFESFGKSVARLMDAFDMNPLWAFNPNADWTSTTHTAPISGEIDELECQMPNIAPWIPSAYQAIYQKSFRNDEVEKLQVGTYNFDSCWQSGYVEMDPSFNFALRYHQRPKDYFTDVRISPIASAVNKLGSQGGEFPSNGASLGSLIDKVDSFLTTGGTYPFSVGFSKVSSPFGTSATNSFDSVSVHQDPTSFSTGYPTGTSPTFLSAANIRALFAVDKFARIYGRADKTYDDQILAHFGIKIPHDVKHDLTRLKHYHLVIQADPIFATANTIDGDEGDSFVSTVGEVGGQGSGTLDSDQEKFTAPVHGVFMCVAYALTKPRYTNTFSKLHLLTNRLSFPIPEYDNLGAQPLYGFEVSRLQLQSANIAQRIGWQNRYQQFKEKYDRCSLAYESGSNGHAPNSENVFSAWVLSRKPFIGYNTATSAFINGQLLFETPEALNTVMYNPFYGAWDDNIYLQPHLAFQSDPILTEFKCFAKKVSWMSETGEPDL